MSRSLNRALELGVINAERVRKVLNENVGLPVMMLAENGPEWHTFYYHEGLDAEVKSLLIGEFSSLPGISVDKNYDSVDEVSCDVSEALFDEWFDLARKNGMKYRFGEIPDDVLSAFLGFPAADFADKVAYEMALAAEWQDWVVITAWL